MTYRHLPARPKAAPHCYWCQRRTRRTVRLPNLTFDVPACRVCYP